MCGGPHPLEALVLPPPASFKQGNPLDFVSNGTPVGEPLFGMPEGMVIDPDPGGKPYSEPIGFTAAGAVVVAPASFKMTHRLTQSPTRSAAGPTRPSSPTAC